MNGLTYKRHIKLKAHKWKNYIEKREDIVMGLFKINLFDSVDKDMNSILMALLVFV